MKNIKKKLLCCTVWLYKLCIKRSRKTPNTSQQSDGEKKNKEVKQKEKQKLACAVLQWVSLSQCICWLTWSPPAAPCTLCSSCLWLPLSSSTSEQSLYLQILLPCIDTSLPSFSYLEPPVVMYRGGVGGGREQRAKTSWLPAGGRLGARWRQTPAPCCLRFRSRLLCCRHRPPRWFGHVLTYRKLKLQRPLPPDTVSEGGKQSELHVISCMFRHWCI